MSTSYCEKAGDGSRVVRNKVTPEGIWKKSLPLTAKPSTVKARMLSMVPASTPSISRITRTGCTTCSRRSSRASTSCTTGVATRKKLKPRRGSRRPTRKWPSTSAAYEKVWRSSNERQSRRGKAGPKAAAQLTKARSALTAAQKAFAIERPAVAEAEKLLRTAAACRGTTEGVLVQKIGQLTVKFTAALSQSRVGRSLLVTNRVLLSKPVVNGLLVVGAALDAIAAYQQSPAQTQAGRLTNAALAAGFGVMIGTGKRGRVAIVDAVLPTGYKLSEIYKGTAAALPAIGEGVLAGDTRAMDEFHARAMKGSYNKVMKAASEAGEYWDQKGLRSGLREFEDSLRWWVSH